MRAHPQMAFGLVRYGWWPAPATRKAVRLVLAAHARRHGLYLADIVELEQTPVRDSLSLARLVSQVKGAVARHGHAVLVTNQPVDPAQLDPGLAGRTLTVIVVDPFGARQDITVADDDVGDGEADDLGDWGDLGQSGGTSTTTG